MKLIIDIPEEEYKKWQEDGEIDALIVRDALVNGVPLQISEDGTLTITVDDATKIGRVLVQNGTDGTLFYADSDCNLDGYSSRLWKNAYKRGYNEAMEDVEALIQKILSERTDK